MITAESLKQYHAPELEPAIDDVYTFMQTLMVNHLAPKSNIVLVRMEDKEDFISVHDLKGVPAQFFSNTSYDSYPDYPRDFIYVIESPDHRAAPITQKVELQASLAHELTHSGSYDDNEHRFYSEALAGIGENMYLSRLQIQGFYLRVPKYGIPPWSSEVVTLRADYAYNDMREYPDEPDSLYDTSSSALLATTMRAAAKATGGMSWVELLRASKPGTNPVIPHMQAVLRQIDPSLPDFVNQQSQSTEGYVLANIAIIKALGKDYLRLAVSA